MTASRKAVPGKKLITKIPDSMNFGKKIEI